MSEIESSTAPRFKGYFAAIANKDGDGEFIAKVINEGVSPKSGKHMVKIQERFYRGMTGTSARVVYGYRDPVWVFQSRVLRTWADTRKKCNP